jgi:hypothetical protein
MFEELEGHVFGCIWSVLLVLLCGNRAAGPGAGRVSKGCDPCENEELDFSPGSSFARPDKKDAAVLVIG